MDQLKDIIAMYGFPIVMAIGLALIINYVWKWVTKEIKPVLDNANATLLALNERVRMLDNDLLRLNQKVKTVVQLRSRAIEHEHTQSEKEINKTPDEYHRDR